MFRLIAIFLVMTALFSAGWQWPRLLSWPDDGGLELALRASWLTCIVLPGLALSCVLRREVYVASWCIWLAVGFVGLGTYAVFRTADLLGQLALLALWIEVAVRAPGNGTRTIAAGAATVHLWMGMWGAVAKVVDPGWMAQSPDVLMRAFGVWAAPLYAVPAGAIVLVSWLVQRKR